MQSMALLAQMDPFRMQPEHIFSYVSFTMIFLFLVWLVDTRNRPIGAIFVLWGMLVAVLSCGYGLISLPTTAIITPALTKISFLLVLSGVTLSVLSSFSNSTEKKEADHV